MKSTAVATSKYQQMSLMLTRHLGSTVFSNIQDVIFIQVTLLAWSRSNAVCFISLYRHTVSNKPLLTECDKSQTHAICSRC